MARPRNTVPTYRKHLQNRPRRRVDLSARRFTHRDLLPGAYGSEESKQEYDRLLCQLRANGGKWPAEAPKKDITIAELVLMFMAHAETYYVDPVTKSRVDS